MVRHAMTRRVVRMVLFLDRRRRDVVVNDSGFEVGRAANVRYIVSISSWLVIHSGGIHFGGLCEYEKSRKSVPSRC